MLVGVCHLEGMLASGGRPWSNYVPPFFSPGFCTCLPRQKKPYLQRFEMGDNGIAGPPAKKRGASRQISKDDSSDSEGGSSAPLESRSFQKAPEEVLASRRIVKVRRTPVSAAAAAPNPFAGIRLVAPPMVMSTPPASEGGCSKDAAATPSEVDENEPGGADEVEDGGKDKQHAGNEVGDGGIDKQHVGEGVQDVGIDRKDGKVTGSATVAGECGMGRCDGESEENTGILKGEGGDYQPVLVASKEGGLGDGYGAKVQPDGGNGDDQPVLLAATQKGSLVGDDSEGQPDGEGKDKTEVNQSGSSEQISEAKVQNLAAPLVPSPSDKGASISLLTPLGKAFPGSFSFGTAPLSSETPTGFASFSSTWATFGSGSASGTSSGSAFAFKAASEGAFSTQSTAFGSSNGSTFQLFSTQTSTSSLTAAPLSQPPASSIQFQEVPVQTGEEQEKVVFGADATLFEFVDGSWKERGKGELKVNVPEDKLAKPRLLMRAKGNYKLLLNAGLFADMKMTSMDSRGVTFACVNSVAEGKNGLTTYAVKFKDGLSAGNFRDAVDAHKSVPHGGLKTPENSPRALHEC